VRREAGTRDDDDVQDEELSEVPYMSRKARGSGAGLGERWGNTSTAHDGGKRGAADVRVGNGVKGNESLVFRAGPISRGPPLPCSLHRKLLRFPG
jgi:hypothetical protein